MTSLPNKERRNGRVIQRSVLLVLTLVGLWTIGSIGWRYLEADFATRHKVPVGPYQTSVPPRIGNIHGVPFSIPAHYLFFPVEYVGESTWAVGHEKPVRTFDSQISNFAILVRWPDLKPRLPENEKSYNESLNNGEPHDWLRVAITAHDLRPSPRADAPNLMVIPQPDNYLARRLTGRLSKPERYGVPEDVRYELRGRDARLSLDIALPVGPRTEKFHPWNLALYWDGDKDRNVSTLIECWNGSFHDSRTVPQCRHSFELPEIKSNITVTYTSNWLPEWRTIETQVKSLILSFQASPHEPVKPIRSEPRS